MPMFGGKSRNCVSVAPLKTRGFDDDDDVVETVSWDCSRTRTTSRGVTVHVSMHVEDVDCWIVPSRDVKMLPDTADSIFCGSDTSLIPALWSASPALCVAVAISARLHGGGVYHLDDADVRSCELQSRGKGGVRIVAACARSK
jgi:hypothetical protein